MSADWLGSIALLPRNQHDVGFGLWLDERKALAGPARQAINLSANRTKMKESLDQNGVIVERRANSVNHGAYNAENAVTLSEGPLLSSKSRG